MPPASQESPCHTWPAPPPSPPRPDPFSPFAPPAPHPVRLLPLLPGRVLRAAARQQGRPKVICRPAPVVGRREEILRRSETKMSVLRAEWLCFHRKGLAAVAEGLGGRGMCRRKALRDAVLVVAACAWLAPGMSSVETVDTVLQPLFASRRNRSRLRQRGLFSRAVPDEQNNAVFTAWLKPSATWALDS